MQPEEVRIVDRGRRMRLIWPDGSSDELTAQALRHHGRDALSQRRGLDGQVTAAADAVAIVDAVPIGRYAVNLRFSDGYDRGIYPWAYLRRIAAGEPVEALGH